MLSHTLIGVIWLLATIACYFLNKRIYLRCRKIILAPLIMTPVILIVLLLLGHIPFQTYNLESHWLLWFMGPATLAFAVPVYEHRQVLKDHWMSMTIGVVTATTVSMVSSVWLARWLMLPDVIQRSLAVRSVTTPFALAATKTFGGQPDLVALFVVITGVFGMAVGDFLFMRLSIQAGMAKGAGFGAASHGAGTARAYEIGEKEGVVASLVMMLTGVVNVLVAPLTTMLMFS